MESLIGFIAALNTLSPLAIIGLLALVLLLQQKNKKALTDVADNHLHDLPDMAASLQRIESLLLDIKDNTVYLKARINGRSS